LLIVSSNYRQRYMYEKLTFAERFPIKLHKSWSGQQTFAYHWNPYWLYRVLN